MTQEPAGKSQETNGDNDRQSRQNKHSADRRTLRQEHTENQCEHKDNIGTVRVKTKSHGFSPHDRQYFFGANGQHK